MWDRQTPSVYVRAEHSPPRDSVRIEIAVYVASRAEPLNLVVPFSLAVGV